VAATISKTGVARVRVLLAGLQKPFHQLNHQPTGHQYDHHSIFPAVAKKAIG
jgi:hypothetical protein